MKKITILLTSVFFAATYFHNANADSYNYTPYFGVDYTFNTTKSKKFNPHYHAIGLHIGSNYSKYFATEIFINASNRDKRKATPENFRSSYYNYGLDIFAYLPICFEEKLSLLATTGIGEYIYKTKFSPTNRWHEHGYGYRFGGGLKYAFDQHWQSRIIGRYINFDKLSGYDHAAEYTFSVEYHF